MTSNFFNTKHVKNHLGMMLDNFFNMNVDFSTEYHHLLLDSPAVKEEWGRLRYEYDFQAKLQRSCFRFRTMPT